MHTMHPQACLYMQRLFSMLSFFSLVLACALEVYHHGQQQPVQR